MSSQVVLFQILVPVKLSPIYFCLIPIVPDIIHHHITRAVLERDYIRDSS